MARKVAPQRESGYMSPNFMDGGTPMLYLDYRQDWFSVDAVD